MYTAAVFIDGGYLTKVLRHSFSEAQIDYGRFAEWATQGCKLFRTYYYDCLPYQSSNPSPEERERVSNKQRFFNALSRLDRFTVRLGRLQYRGTDDDGAPIFQQKRVDLQLGLDLALLVAKDRVNLVALVSGDSDLIPAVVFAQQEGVIVRLIHGPSHPDGRPSYHQDLWDQADERLELTNEVVKELRR